MPRKPGPNRCIACQGTRISSSGRECVPCRGTGLKQEPAWKKFMEEEKPSPKKKFKKKKRTLRKKRRG